MIRLFLFLAALLLSGLTGAAAVQAHALQPGYLEITEIGGGNWRVFWRKPDVRGRPMAIEAQLPQHCTPRTGPGPAAESGAWVESWVAECRGGLGSGAEGGEIRIQGLERTNTDVLVRYEDGGEVRSVRLTPDRPFLFTGADPGNWDVMRSYVPLGIEHILQGADHLLFVFALLLLIPGKWRLLGAVTAFTVAHSITMAAAALGWVALPGPPVEAVIALSIMFLASELLQREAGRDRLSQRYPWTVSFTFGLLHGFGFAGALREIGLPQSDVPLALLSFNLGVEIGQLMFVGAVLLLGYVAGRLAPTVLAAVRAPQSRAAVASAYVIGGLAAFWFIERISGFWA